MMKWPSQKQTACSLTTPRHTHTHTRAHFDRGAYPAQLCVWVWMSLVQQPPSDFLQLLLLSLPVTLVCLHLLLSVAETFLQRTAPRGHRGNVNPRSNLQRCMISRVRFGSCSCFHSVTKYSRWCNFQHFCHSFGRFNQSVQHHTGIRYKTFSQKNCAFNLEYFDSYKDSVAFLVVVILTCNTWGRLCHRHSLQETLSTVCLLLPEER